MPRKRQTEGQLTLKGVHVPYAPHSGNSNTVYDEVRTSLSARLGSKREAYRGNGPTGSSVVPPDTFPKNPPKVEQRSLAERLKIFKEFHGFLPLSRNEATHGLRLLDDLGTPFATIRYLRAVEGRQARPDVDIIHSQRTSLGLIRQFGNFAVDARMTRMLSKDVVERLDGVRHDLKMRELIESNSNDEPIYTEMLTPFYRHHVVKKAVGASVFDRSTYEDMGAALDFDYLVAPIEGEYQESLLAFAGTMTVMGIRLNAQDMDIEHMYRSTFWDARVGESNRYIPGRPARAMVNGRDARAFYVEPPAVAGPAQAVNG